ncbi:MAG: D-glycero-beta-D-manno-heptose 1-phosphate adenylyltransferase [Flavobacteriales bacterium]
MMPVFDQFIENKIYELDRLVKQIAAWRLKGDKIVFTNGCFDILHLGHAKYLAEARSLGNRLIIGLNSDLSVKRLKGAERPVNKEKDRSFLLASLLQTDGIVLFQEDTPADLISAIKPDILVKGGDYSEHEIVGADFVKSHGGQVVIIPFVNGYSTTGIIEKSNKMQ